MINKVIGDVIYAVNVVDGFTTLIPLCRTSPGFDGLVLTPEMSKRLMERLK